MVYSESLAARIRQALKGRRDFTEKRMFGGVGFMLHGNMCVGVWAPAATIDRIRAELEAERSTEGYAKRKEADARRRDKAQVEYVDDFHAAVLKFLAFHPKHAVLANWLARAVADHATPVGSGTVARTKRIPVEQRAEAAVIAWLRHRTIGLLNSRPK